MSSKVYGYSSKISCFNCGSATDEAEHVTGIKTYYCDDRTRQCEVGMFEKCWVHDACYVWSYPESGCPMYMPRIGEFHGNTPRHCPLSEARFKDEFLLLEATKENKNQ